MNKALFGTIGILLLGVAITGVLAWRGNPTGTAYFADTDSDSLPSIPAPVASSTAAEIPASPPAPQPSDETSKPIPAPPVPEPKPGAYTMAQVAMHNSQTSCYTAINGSVYDVTSFIRQHPGGSRAILSLCGTDGTAAFEGQHGSQGRPTSELASFKVGVLAP